MICRAVTTALAFTALTACDSASQPGSEATAGKLEQVETTAAGSSSPTALGLTETQLLEADLVNADGTDLGDVKQVRRNAAGIVESVLVELENTDPDRYVLVPMSGLTIRADGDDTDLQTNMTAAQLAAMPDAVS